MSDKSTVLMPAFDDELRNILTQETPREVVKTRKGKGGKRFSYVEHAWVTSQLNTAFNWGWSWEIVEWQLLPTPTEPSEVFALGRLTVHTSNGDIVKMQFGTQAIKRDKQNNILSIGDDLKAASSDGLKKAASLLGLALDLYKSDAPPDDDEDHISNDPMTAYWAAAKAKGLTQDEGAALLAKHRGNPDRALKELTMLPKSNGTEAAKAEFFARVLAEIPYFEHINHAANALKQLGFTTYSKPKEEEMFSALEAHASEAANREAA